MALVIVGAVLRHKVLPEPVMAEAVEPPIVRLVAVATPRFGVVNDGLVVPAGPPVPDDAPASNVITPAPVVVVAGAAPAPPPIIKAFAANAADDAHVDALLK